MIGFLNCYHFDKASPPYQLHYSSMFLDFFKNIPSEIKTYKTGLGEVPQDINECDGWIISGSPKSAYDDDEWIKNLSKFIRECDSNKKKMVGICFGHQLVAYSLGGKTEKSKNGWGIGIKKFNMIKKKHWMNPELKEVSLLFSHQDQVTKLPENAELLATDTFCPNEMYSIDDHVLCLQGHPEFTKTFIKDRLESRSEIIEPKTYKTAIESLNQETNSAEVGSWIKNFLF